MIKVLKNWDEIGFSITKFQEEVGILHTVPQKNWDLLYMTEIINDKVKSKNAPVLDTGCSGCPVLEVLLRYGYSNLFGIDLRVGIRERFERIFLSSLHRRDFRILYGYSPIKLKKMNICKTKFPDNMFSAITSLSVVEHGIAWEDYFKEMFRLLAPGGYLITSVDYWTTPIDTRGKYIFGQPMKIFTLEDIKEALSIAFRHGFKKIEVAIPECESPCVPFEGFHYTFILFCLQKPNKASNFA